MRLKKWFMALGIACLLGGVMVKPATVYAENMKTLENLSEENQGTQTPEGENQGTQTPEGENQGEENQGTQTPEGENQGTQTPEGENPGMNTPAGETSGEENKETQTPEKETSEEENKETQTPEEETSEEENKETQTPEEENQETNPQADEPWICLVDENGTGIAIQAAEDSSGENWSYKAATKTLTLNGFHGRELDIQSEELCIFLVPGTVNVLEGDEIPLHVKEDVNEKLVITGGGTLELNVTDNAALIAMNLELQGGRVTANNEVYCIETAVISGGSLEISREMNPVLTVNNELTISGGSVKLVGAENDYYALMLKKNLTVSGGELYVESGNMAISMIEEGTFRMDGGSVCLKALGEGVNGRETHVQMNGGTLDIEAGGWYGMTVSDMVMTGGTLTIEAEMMGLEMEKSLVVTGGNVEISVTEEDGNPITPADFKVDKSVNMNLSGGNCSGFINGVVGGEQVSFLLHKEPAYLYDSEDSYYQALESTYYKRIRVVDWSGMTKEENERKSREIDIAFIEEWAGISIDDIDGFNMIDISNPYQVDISAGAAITFPVAGVSEGDNIVVLHLKSDGTWERISATAGNGVITGTFTSLSPVCYAKLVDKSEAGAGEYVSSVVIPTAVTEVTEEEPVSPKTGESNITLYVAALAMIAFCGVVYQRRREK